MPDGNRSLVARLDRVDVRFAGTAALQQVDFAAAAGEVTVLLGPAGAGKTTALRVITGRLMPSSGTARLFGVAPRALAARARLGVMLAATTLPAMLRVAEIVALHSGYYAAPRPLAETLRLADLTALAERPIGTLSRDDRRRLDYALAVCGHPDLVVLDDPAAGLAVAAQPRLWRAIRDDADGGTAVIVATRSHDIAARLADRTVVITDGRIAADEYRAAARSRPAAFARGGGMPTTIQR